MADFEIERLKNIERNKRALEALGLLDGPNLIPPKPVKSKTHREHKRRVWQKTDRVMRDARIMRPPQRLSPDFSSRRAYERPPTITRARGPSTNKHPWTVSSKQPT